MRSTGSGSRAGNATTAILQVLRKRPAIVLGLVALATL